MPRSIGVSTYDNYFKIIYIKSHPNRKAGKKKKRAMHIWKRLVYIMNLTTACSNYVIEKNNDVPACLTVTDSHPEEGGDPKGV